ncbi:MAG TPA: tetratricopeptide repeat protein [Marmoricola sp.]|nr:tetratricopeptide repeat protein [Marmoricola sp.]
MTDDFELTAPAIIFPGMAQPESAYRAAYDLLCRRFPREALDLIEPALAAEPGNTGLRTLLAWAYLQRAQLGKAEEVLRGLIEVDPTDVWAQHALGRALERQSKYAEALPHLRLAAVMSDDWDHQAAAFRVERRFQESAE